MSEVTGMGQEFTLPLGGNQAVVRGMTGHEEDLLTDKKLLKKNKVMDKILHSCIETIDGKKPTEAEVLALSSSDRTYILVKIREMSYGEFIEDAEIKCQNKDCNEKTYYDIDLTTLEVTTSENGADEEFEFELPVTKTRVKFRHQDGNDEQKLAKFGQTEILTVGMMLRLTEVTTSNGEEIHSNGYKKWLKALPVRDRSALRKEMESKEVGIDTKITFNCEDCGTENTIRVESLPAFFFPEM